MAVSLDLASRFQVLSLKPETSLVHCESDPLTTTLTSYPKHALLSRKIANIKSRNFPNSHSCRKQDIQQCLISYFKITSSVNWLLWSLRRRVSLARNGPA